MRQGRDPNDLRIYIMGASEEPEDLANLHREGVEHACLTIWSEDSNEILRRLDQFAQVAAQARENF